MDQKLLDENQELRALLAERDRQLTAARLEVETLRVRLEVAEEAAVRLQRDLAHLRGQLAGNHSERLDPSRLPLPEGRDTPEGSDTRTKAETSSEDAAKGNGEKGRRKLRWKNRTKNHRRDISEMDELETVEHRSTVQVRTCPCGCGAPAETVGHDVSWRLERIPAKTIRHKIIQEKVVFPGHSELRPTTKGTVVTAPPPVSYALPKAICANGLLAEVVTDKYADHLPLYRQSERFAREGIDLPRSTLCGWMMDLANLLQPMAQWLKLQVRSGDWLRADATGMPVLDEAHTKGKAHHGHLWAWGNYETVIFQYTSNKEGKTVKSLFEGFKGTVLIDGGTDFNLLEKTDGIVRAGCWAHARRYLYEALKDDAKRALQGLGSIRHLFLAERIVMATPVEDRLALREELCKPILDGIRKWVDEELPKVVPKTLIHGALQYLHNQWPRLTTFLSKPQIACHNNDTERDLRRPVKGRDNYLFAGSPRGAEAAAVYYTLIGTCLLQGIDPKRYLVEILGRLDEPRSRLTPHAIREEWEAIARARIEDPAPDAPPAR